MADDFPTMRAATLGFPGILERACNYFENDRRLTGMLNHSLSTLFLPDPQDRSVDGTDKDACRVDLVSGFVDYRDVIRR